ncbi:MAG TPA: hypothetical protein VEA37_02605 [Flavobacterium sp.]|nr:hypothetical protein [Flavobacterium sp.]
MKRFLVIIVLLLSITVFSQRQYRQVYIGEYANYFKDTSGNAFTYDAGILSRYDFPEKIDTGSAGHPWSVMIGKSGQVYHTLGDSKAFKTVNISNGANSASYWNYHAVVRKDGRLTVYNDNLEMVDMAGVRYKSVAAGHYLIALDYDGNVWEFAWSKSQRVVKSITDLAVLKPVKKNLPAPASSIATSRSIFSGALVNGEPWIWCDAFGAPYIGLKKATPNPVNAYSLWGLTEKLKKMVMSDNVTHMLTITGKLLGLGNTWVGEIGDGSKAAKAVQTGLADHAYKQFIVKAVHIRPDIVFIDIFASNSYGFRHFALDENFYLYSWGYAKFGLLANGIRPFDDPKNVVISSIPVPHRIVVPRQLIIISTNDLYKMISGGFYPPDEPVIFIRKVIKVQIIREYNDGTIEVEDLPTSKWN